MRGVDVYAILPALTHHPCQRLGMGMRRGSRQSRLASEWPASTNVPRRICVSNQSKINDVAEDGDNLSALGLAPIRCHRDPIRAINLRQ